MMTDISSTSLFGPRRLTAFAARSSDAEDEGHGATSTKQQAATNSLGSSAGKNGPDEDPEKELRGKGILIPLVILDAAGIAALLFSDGALDWLTGIPFLSGITKFAHPLIAAGTLLQVALLVVFGTVELLLSQWEKLHKRHGVLEPNPHWAFGFVIVSLIAVGLIMPHQKLNAVIAGGNVKPQHPPAAIVTENPASAEHLPSQLRLVRRVRGVAQEPDEFFIGAAVATLELQTSIAYSKIEHYSITLDGVKIETYQMRNKELSVTVDHERLSPGQHTLKIVITNRAGTHHDPVSFLFNIVDIQ